MHRAREILRQKWILNLPNRTIAQSVGCGPSTVFKVVSGAREAELSWEAVCALDDAALE